MPIKRPQLINEEIYHIVSRGVGDSLIFQDINDYYRGIFSLYEFNNVKSVNIWLRRQQRKKRKSPPIKSIARTVLAITAIGSAERFARGNFSFLFYAKSHSFTINTD